MCYYSGVMADGMGERETVDSPNEQEEAARQLRVAQNLSRLESGISTAAQIAGRSPVADSSDDEEEGSERGGRAFRAPLAAARALRVGVTSRLNAIKAGIELGMTLRQEIEDTNFSGGVFWTVLLLSIVKDAWDLIVGWADLGLSGTLINVVITVALFITFFFKINFFEKMFWRIVWAMGAEFIPLLDLFPSYVISTILLKYHSEKKVRELEEQLKNVQLNVARNRAAVRGANQPRGRTGSQPRREAA